MPEELSPAPSPARIFDTMNAYQRTAAFSLVMLGSTPSGDAYTFPEFASMFAHAGFSRSEFHPLPPTMEQVVTAYR